MSDITTRAREMTAALCAALEVAEAERDALRADRLRHMREFDALRAEVERLRAVEAESAAMREALPSILDITTRARALLAAATPGPWEADAWYNCDDGGWAAIGPHHMATEDEGYDDVPESPAHHRAIADAALIAAAPELIASLCDEVERLRAELASVMTECARLRSDIDIEREQSAAFVKEVERLRVVEAGAAVMRRVLNEVGRYAEWASTVREALRDGAGKDFLIQLLSAESDLAHARQELAFGREYTERALDAASAEKERLRAEIEKERAEVKRLRARKAEPVANYTQDGCPKCGGSGAVIVEGEK